VARQILLKLVEQRGWKVPATQKRRVEACRDPDLLASWIERITTARTLTEVLAS